MLWWKPDVAARESNDPSWSSSSWASSARASLSDGGISRGADGVPSSCAGSTAGCWSAVTPAWGSTRCGRGGGSGGSSATGIGAGPEPGRLASGERFAASANATPVLAAAVVIIAAWATGIGSAAAAPQHNPKGKFLGLVHAGRGQGKASLQAPLAASNLAYHGGPVMHTSRTHAIYWEPSGFSTTSTYKSLINTYLGDVAADSNKHSDVYASDVQYTDGTGNAAYNSTFAGAIVATDAYPASGCTD